jgi:hypothetical protein
MMVRNSVSRANQNGPEAYGFRGNGQNLDLNRDCIKQDSKNARAFAKLYTEWRPDVFIDTHTSNGADYQYIMTYIATMKDKLDPGLAAYMETTLNPEIDHEDEGCQLRNVSLCANDGLGSRCRIRASVHSMMPRVTQ